MNLPKLIKDINSSSTNQIKISSEDTITSHDSVNVVIKRDEVVDPSKKSKNNMTNTECPHKDEKHYAKNKCYNCYHREGRNKKAWACAHVNKSHYALGLCHNCYQNNMVKKSRKSKSVSSVSISNNNFEHDNLDS